MAPETPLPHHIISSPPPPTPPSHPNALAIFTAMPPRPKIQIPVWRACEHCRINRVSVYHPSGIDTHANKTPQRKCPHKYAVLLPRKIDGPDATPQPLKDTSLIAYAADPSYTRKVRKRNASPARSGVGEDNIEGDGEGWQPPTEYEPRMNGSDQSGQPSVEALPPRVYLPSPNITTYPSTPAERGYVNSRGASQVEDYSVQSAPYLLPIRPATERKYTTAMPAVQHHYHQQPMLQHRQNTKYGLDSRSRWTNSAKASTSRFSGPRKVTPLTAGTRR